MRLVYLSLNRNSAEILRSCFLRSNIQVSMVSDFERAHHILQNPVDIILVDFYLGSKSGISIMKQLQTNNPGIADVEIWLTAYGLDEKSQTIQNAMHDISANRYWPQPFSALDMLDALESDQEEDSISLSPTAVRILGQVWASKSSVVLTGSNSRLIFANGALIREDPSDSLVEALQEDYLSIAPIQNVSGGNWFETGQRLIGYCSKGDYIAWQEEYIEHAFTLKILKDINGLDLPDALLRLIANQRALRSLRTNEEAYSAMYALWMLGLLEARERVKVESVVERVQQVQRTSKRQEDFGWILQEYERLKDAEPAIVLGIPAKADDKLARAAVERMTMRYNEIQQNPKLGEEIRHTAREMLKVVKKASGKFFSNEIDASKPQHIQLFEYAKQLMEQKNWEKAQKALHKAHQMRIEDPNILSHLGWAQYKNDASNFDEALENLQLSLHLEPSSVDTLIFLSKIFVEKEDYESAMPFLRKVSTLTPDPEIQELRQLAENEIKRQARLDSN
ncbi:MAG: hypothetical protein VX278_05045 [Myxococcota bacterium]|nr:hypothetical protein [Myxococcota bacterium]